MYELIWGTVVIPAATAACLFLTWAGGRFMDTVERDLAEASARALDRERVDPSPRTDLDRLLRRQIP